MTLNQVLALFQRIADVHHNFKGSFGFGNLFELNGELKPGLRYPLLWLVPVSSSPTEQTKQRTFNLLVLDLVKKDKSNRDEVWSDTEQYMDDVIKILRYENHLYDLIGDPVYEPIDEQYSDWVTGWTSPITIESKFNSNYCDIPKDDL